MKLTFNDLDRLMRLAARVGRRLRDEDAEHDALLELLDVEFDASYSERAADAYLVRTVVGRLIRRRQNETGARLKTPPVFMPLFDVEEEEEETDERWARLRRVVDRLEPDERRIAEALLEYKSQATTAAQLDVTRGRVAQVVAKLRRRVALDAAFDRAEEEREVSDDLRRQYPLLFLGDRWK